MSTFRYASLLLLLALPLPLFPQSSPEGPEFEFEPPPNQHSPAVAGNSLSGFLVVWVHSADGILAQRFESDGTTRGPRVELTQVGSSPAVAMNDAGAFAVVWQELDRDGSDQAIVGQSFDGFNSPHGADFQVNTYTTGRQTGPSVAMDSTGAFTVVWASRDQDGSASSVFGQRFATGGAPIGTEFAVNSMTIEWQLGPDISVNQSTGEFVVVWESYVAAGLGSDAMARRFASNGVPGGPEFQVNTEDVGYTLGVRTAMNEAGEFVVVWWRPDASDYGVFGRVLDSVDPALPEFQVNTYTTGYQQVPDVAIGSTGTFLVVWKSDDQDGDGTGIFGREFQIASTAPFGSDWQVNTETPGNQSMPSVAAHGTGRFTTMWRSQQDGVVHGQRYSASCPLAGPVTDLTVDTSNLGASLILHWTDVNFATDYIVFEDVSTGGPFASVLSEAPSGTPGLELPMPSEDRYFLIVARNICGVGPR